MWLVELIDGDVGTRMNAAALDNIQIAGITCDSREVREGYLFAAIPGTQDDGRLFISDAIKRGAAAILAPPGTVIEPPDIPVPIIIDDNPRRQYALMVARFFTNQPAIIACVTGTNGKTSVVSFLRQIWAAAGYNAASAGTLGVELSGDIDGDELVLRHGIKLTTPDPASLHRSLAELAGHGINHLGLEASSHGLAQFRLDGVRVAAGAFTNLTHDHLDYHGDEVAYLAAKARLFSEIVVDGGTAVINADIPEADGLRAVAADRGLRVIDYGHYATDLVLTNIVADGGGQTLALDIFGRRHDIRLPLLGTFQASNALAALGLAVATGVSEHTAVSAMAELEGVRGRIELVARHSNGAAIFVDYAHTPDALKKVLETLRPHLAGELHVVFGCGGDRDPDKRAAMGRCAAAAAEHVILTDDNPRTENPAEIRKATRVGCPDALEIGDRAEAIAEGIQALKPGDILVVAGKGHELGQIVGDTVIPFDDAELVRQVVQDVNG